MSLKDIHIVDIYNEKDLLLIKNFDLNIYNELNSIVSDNTKNKEEYNREQKYSVINNKYYANIKDEKINCFVKAVIAKDTKVASLYPEFLTYKKDFIPNLCEYLLLNNIEEVFVFVKKEEDKLIKELVNKKFISLATDDNNKYIPFLIEKNLDKEEIYHGDFKKY